MVLIISKKNIAKSKTVGAMVVYHLYNFVLHYSNTDTQRTFFSFHLNCPVCQSNHHHQTLLVILVLVVVFFFVQISLIK